LRVLIVGANAYANAAFGSLVDPIFETFFGIDGPFAYTDNIRLIDNLVLGRAGGDGAEFVVVGLLGLGWDSN